MSTAIRHRSIFHRFAAPAIMCALGVAGMYAIPGAVAEDPVTYSQDVAPIFFEHCAMCHRPGEVAPMSLLSYREARPWAKSIAKAVSTHVMPPWSGESDRRTWSNDISLSDAEIETIVAWVEQGATQGNPKDLPDVPEFPETWTLGEPDYIITLDEVAVPADGEDIFSKRWAVIDIDEPQWINAIEFLPGDRRAAHHMQTTYTLPKGADLIAGAEAASKTGILAIWTAGMPPFEFPEGMGRIVAPGTKVLADAHYHPFGEATTDRTRIGLHFGKGELKKEVATVVAVNTGIRIPPGASHHAETAFHIFDKDMQILAFSPHMHVRGKSMRYDLVYPDGRTETLLNVPNYNYNWQWQYYPTEAIDVPAGSRLNVTGVWDNSENNPFNPDPSQEILYRGNTFNEMFVGFFEVIEKDGVFHKPMSPSDKIKKLLAAHPAEDSYFAGGFLPFGLYAPKEGEGMVYLVQGLSMFTISLDDLEWDGNKFHAVAQFPTLEASATTTLIDGELDENGHLRGKVQYGVDGDNLIVLPMNGQPMTTVVL